MSKRGTKAYYNEINLLSYNNRDLVYETWSELKSLNDIINSNDEKLNQSITIKPTMKTIDEINNFDSDSEFSDSDEDNFDDVSEVKIKDNFYIVKNGYLFIKNNDGTCGKIYGVYKNTKIQKFEPEKHIEV